MSITVPCLFTSCEPAKKSIVQTLSGDISHKNLFEVRDTIIINKHTTPNSLCKEMRNLALSKKHVCGVYLQNAGDNTQIKHVFALMGIYEDIPEHNEVYWQSLAVTVSKKAVFVNIPKAETMPPHIHVSSASDSFPPPNKYYTPPPKENSLPPIPEPQKSSCFHKNGYVLIPLILKNGHTFLDEEKVEVKKLGKKFSTEKICITFHFANSRDSVSQYWQFIKESAKLAQGRFQFSNSWD